MPSPFTANPFTTGTYDPDRAREWIRGTVPILSVLAFLSIVLFYLYQAVRADTHWSQVKDAMSSVLPAVTGVLGTVLGFYFGSQKR